MCPAQRLGHDVVNHPQLQEILGGEAQRFRGFPGVLAAGNTVLMLENAIYSVIPPEGCSAILWRDGEHAREAAEALRLTAQDLLQLGVVDHIVPEPLGGAHRLPKEAVEQLGMAIDEALRSLLGLDGDALRHQRREKFLAMGQRGL